MNLSEHQIFDSRQPEALEGKNKTKRLMTYLAMIFFSPQSSRSKQHKKNLCKDIPLLYVIFFPFISGKPRTSLRNPTASLENQNHNEPSELGIKRFGVFF